MHPLWRSPWPTALVAAILVLGTAFALGQDANWDLLNYHLYTPLAWLDGRLDQDIAVAQLQTWHNPLLDVPFAWMVQAGASGWAMTLWLSLPAFVALFAALRLMDALWPEHRSLLRTLAAGAVAATGVAAWSGTGSSLNDAYVGAGMLSALWWIVASRGRRGPWATWLPVGLLAGAVAGLKLTAAMYCIGFAAAALVAGPVRELPSRIVALAAGGLFAVLVTWGPWGWRLWEQTGNPLFPYFNDWFHSPDAPQLPNKDVRFLAKTWSDALLTPVHLLRTSTRFSELEIKDPRLLLGMLALFAWSALIWRGRRARLAGSEPSAVATTARETGNFAAVLAFVAVSYALWLAMYGIYRYLYPLELIFAVAIFGMLSMLPSPRWRAGAMLIAAFLIFDQTKLPIWAQQPFRDPMVDVRFPPLPPRSMVLISSWEPVGHAAAFLPRDVPVVSVYNNLMAPARCTRLQARAEKRVADHAGPIFLLRPGPSDPGADQIRSYGLSIAGACRPIEDSLLALELCRLDRTPVKPVCSAPPADR